MQPKTGLMKTDRPERYAEQLVSRWTARGPVVDEADGLVQRWTTDAGLLVRVSVSDGEDVNPNEMASSPQPKCLRPNAGRSRDFWTSGP